MADPLDPRLVLLLTLLGLTGCALIATLHPPESFDPTRVADQAGRNVAVDLEIATASRGDGWLRGEAYPRSQPTSAPVAWLWFRPPEPGPLPGDRIVGSAQVSADGRGTALLLDGANAARIDAGPHPVPVHWDDLLHSPERLGGRLLLVNGAIDGPWLRAPDGRSACALAEPARDDALDRTSHTVRLVRDKGEPGWSCRIEAAR